MCDFDFPSEEEQRAFWDIHLKNKELNKEFEMSEEKKLPFVLDGVMYYVDKPIWDFIEKCLGYEVENYEFKKIYHVMCDIPVCFNNKPKTSLVPFYSLSQRYFMTNDIGKAYIDSIIEENRILKKEDGNERLLHLEIENKRLREIIGEDCVHYPFNFFIEKEGVFTEVLKWNALPKTVHEYVMDMEKYEQKQYKLIKELEIDRDKQILKCARLERELEKLRNKNG